MSEIEQDPFIGQRFGEGGHLVVVGRDTEKYSSGGKRYLVKCHICSSDKEMYGSGLFPSTKQKLLDGLVPCGCNKLHRLTNEQIVIKLRRECSRKNYDLVGQDHGRLYAESKVVIRCRKHNYSWTTQVQIAAHGRTGCRRCAGEIPDEDRLKLFKSSGKFLDGTDFVSRGPTLWEVICPKCSNDEYVQQGFCDGRFFSPTTSLLKGHKSCRCSPKYKWSESMQRYRIENLAKADSQKFNGWDGEYKGVYTNCLIECEPHGTYQVKAHEYINKGSRCPKCATNRFKASKPAHLYVLRIVSDSGEAFTGYGISNNLEQRLKSHKTKLARANFVIAEQEVFPTHGTIAITVESMIKSNFELLSQSVDGFIKEATHYYMFDDVIKFVEEQITLLENDMIRPAEPSLDNDDARPDIDERVLEELGFDLLKQYERTNE